MPANENEIGLRAVLDTKDFESGTRRLDALYAKLKGDLGAFEKEHAATYNQMAQEEDQSTKRMIKASTENAQAHTKSINQVVSGFRNAAFILAGVTAAIIINYKKLDEAARTLGDTEIVAEFDALDTTVSDLGKTIMASELELLRVSDILTGMTGIIETLRQTIAITTGGLVYMIALMQGMQQTSIGIGIKGVGGVQIGTGNKSLAEIEAEARAKANEAFLGAAFPSVKKGATELPDTKEAQKEREKNEQKLADYIQKIHDLQIKSGEDLQSAEKDYQDKSASNWQSYIDKVSDIVAEGVKKRADLLQTYNDAIASAEHDYQRGVEDAAYNHSKRMANIERDYQDTVRNIQQTYQEDALDAVRNLDAIGLIRAREKRDKDLANATQTRDRANSDENENYGRQLYELQRSLEDKKREAEQAYQRGLEDQRRAEQDAMQAAKDALNQQNADAKQSYDERLAAIKQSYANETAEAQAHYLNQEAALQAHLQAMQAIMAAYGMSTGTPTRKVSGPRAEGGIDIVNTPTQFTAGEAGPEMAMFIPLNRALPSPVAQTVNHVGDFSHSIDAAVNSSVAGLDGRIIAAVRKAIGEVIR